MNNLILKTWQINLDFIVKQLLRKNLKIVDFILRKLCILVAWRQEKASYYVNIFAYFWGILKLMWHLNQIRFLIGLDKKNSSFVSESRDFGSQFIYCLLQSPVERFSCSLGLSQCTHLNFWEWGRPCICSTAPQATFGLCAGRQPLLGPVTVRTEKGRHEWGRVIFREYRRASTAALSVKTGDRGQTPLPPLGDEVEPLCCSCGETTAIVCSGRRSGLHLHWLA